MLANRFCSTSCQNLVQFRKQVSSWYDGQKIEAITCHGCCYVGFQTPDDKVLSEYYSLAYEKEISTWYNLESDYAEDKVISRAKDTIKILQKYGCGGDAIDDTVIIELGCAFGGTVGELRNRGYAAYGTDFNPDAIHQGQKHGNAYIYNQPADEFLRNEKKKANLIYSYHTLEHISDPVRFLENLKPCLADDAVLTFRVPNGAYLRAWLEGFDKWDWFSYPSHLHMFTPRSLICLTESTGYELLSVTSAICSDPLERLTSLFTINLSTSPEKLSGFYQALLGTSLLLEELRFEICVKDSGVARKHAPLLAATKAQCIENGHIEIAIKETVIDAKHENLAAELLEAVKERDLARARIRIDEILACSSWRINYPIQRIKGWLHEFWN